MPDTQPIELSVIIPVYNGEHWIDGQLDALAEQEADFRWEVIVADNGSTDDTRNHVIQRAESFPAPLRVVDASARRGVAHARNAGVTAARAEKFAICDCDDRVAPGWVAAAHRGLDEFDAVCGPLQSLRPSGELTPSPQISVPTKASFGWILQGCNFGARREVYLDVGGMDETLSGYGTEDAEFSLRLSESGARVGVQDDMVVYFRPTPIGLNLIRKVYRSALTEVEVWHRHPQRFRSQMGIGRALHSLVAFPRFAATERSSRRIMREGLRRIAHVHAQLSYRPQRSATTQSVTPPPFLSVRTALWVTPVSDLAGVARHVLDITRQGLDGWRIVVLCPEGPLATRLREQGTAVIAAPFGPSAGIRSSRHALQRAITALHPAIVHSHLAYADLMIASVGLPRGTRRVTTEHGIAGEDDVYHGSTLESRAMALVHRARFPRFDAVIAVSRATRDAMVKKWKVRQRIWVVPNGVSTPSIAAIRSHPAELGPRILSLSRLAPEKRIGVLIEAFAHVRESRVDATLTIAGEGALEVELRQRVNDLGITDCVFFPGYIDSDIAMAQADILVQLSVWENCSYTLLDAQACNIRVVASDAGGNREIIDADSLVPTVSPQTIAARILTGRKFTGHHRRPTTVAEMCAKTVDVYDNITSTVEIRTTRGAA